MASVDDLRDRARAGGEQVSSGRFKIDTARALAKLRDHRLVDPHHYVLELLRAATACGASWVNIRNDADDLELTFDSRIPAAVIRDLFGHALSGGTDRQQVSYRMLALGVNAALALKPSFVDVTSDGVTLRARPPDRLESSDANPKTSRDITRVHVKERVSWRVLRDAVSGAPEGRVVEKWAPHYPSKLHLNGKRLDAKVDFGDVLARRERHTGGRDVVAAVLTAPREGSELTLDLLGVNVVTRRVTLPGLPIVAWARDDSMRRNASGSDVVNDDPGYQKVLTELQSLAGQLVRDVTKLVEGGAPAPEARRVLTAAALELMKRPQAIHAKVAKPLRKAPIIPGPDGEWHSIEQLIAESAAGKMIRFSRVPCAREHYDGIVVLMANATVEQLVPAGPMEDIAATIALRKQREENRRRWESQPVEEPLLQDVGYAATGPIRTPGGSAGGIVGRVGLLGNDAGDSVVRFLLKGRPLEQRIVRALRPLRVHAAVDSTRFNGDESWSGVAEDGAFEQAVAAIRQAGEEIILAAVGEHGDDPSAALREHAFDLLAAITRGGSKNVPDALARARLFRVVGGRPLSLAALRELDEVRWVSYMPAHGALDGKPVIVLERERDLVNILVPGALRDWDTNLSNEQAIRARQAVKHAATLQALTIAKVALGDDGDGNEKDGLRGEIGVPATGTGLTLELRLLCEGVLLEEGTTRGQYGPAVAVVESAALRSTDDFTGVRKDAAHRRAMAAVENGRRRLGVALLMSYAGTTREHLPPVVREFLSGMLRHELRTRKARAHPDEIQAKLLDAPLFAGAHGPLSLRQIDEAALKLGKVLLVASSMGRADLPASLPIVVGDLATAHLLDALFDEPIEEPGPEVERERRREVFRQQPEMSPTEPLLPLRVPIEGKVRGEIGYLPANAAAGGGGIAILELLHTRRRYTTYETPDVLGLRGVLDLDDEDLDIADPNPPVMAQLAITRALAAAVPRLIGLALEDPSRPGARELLLHVLAERETLDLTSALSVRIASVPIFPTLDGRTVAAEELTGLSSVPYATRALDASLSTPRSPVVLAEDLAVRRALAATPNAIDITQALVAQLQRGQVAKVGQVSVGAGAATTILARRRFAWEGFDGEVAFVTSDSDGRVEIFHEQRPLAEHKLAVPCGVVAALDATPLPLDVARVDVVRGLAYEQMIERVRDAAEALAIGVAQAWESLDADKRTALAPVMGRIACWLIARKRKDNDNDALRAPVLRTTAGAPMSGADLLAEHERTAAIRWASVGGELLHPDRPIWWPRTWEHGYVSSIGLTLTDATPVVTRAAEVLALPPRTSLMAEQGSLWRELIAEQGVAGELALPVRPTGKLVIELLKDRRVVEKVVIDHAVGAVAQVNGKDLSVDDMWTSVARDAAFDRVVALVGAALERLLGRYLAAARSVDDSSWTTYLLVAARWQLNAAGPLAIQLRQLPLFTSTDGSEVSIGLVMSEIATRGRIEIASSHGLRPRPRAAADHLVLAGPDSHRHLLEALSLGPVADVTGALKAARDREERLSRQRVSELRGPRDAVVRLSIDDGGWTGELALADPPDPDATITLVRDGIAVDHVAGGGVSGMLAHAELPVDEDYTEARLEPVHAAQIQRFAAAVYGRLAAVAAEGSLTEAQRIVGGRHVLRWLAHTGVNRPEHLDFLSGPAEALARAKLFRTADGRWIDLRAIGDRAIRRPPVPMLGFSVSADEIGDDVVLDGRMPSPELELRTLIGGARVTFLDDRRDWKAWRAEADPDSETPLGKGLTLLRREAALLRADACGRLQPGELTAIRLREGNGKTPVVYDAPRRVAFLDSKHVGVRRALEESGQRPDRIYLILASIYGAVNRALERVTDEDEARVASALLAHLRANPEILNDSSK